MSDTLIQRLRAASGGYDGLEREAATELERLTAEVARLTENNIGLNDCCAQNEEALAGCGQREQEFTDEVRRLTAELAAARALLGEALDCDTNDYLFGSDLADRIRAQSAQPQAWTPHPKGMIERWNTRPTETTGCNQCSTSKRSW